MATPGQCLLNPGLPGVERSCVLTRCRVQHDCVRDIAGSGPGVLGLGFACFGHHCGLHQHPDDHHVAVGCHGDRRLLIDCRDLSANAITQVDATFFDNFADITKLSFCARDICHLTLKGSALQQYCRHRHERLLDYDISANRV